MNSDFYDILVHDRMIMLRFSAWLVFSCAQVFLSFQYYALAISKMSHPALLAYTELVF